MAAVELKIDGNAPIGAIMSVNFYNEPLWSTIREVMANAIDATIASDSSELPVLSVNTYSRKISVRDFGFGLSEEDIYKVFGGLFKSTKREDLEATGGFGLGSKSPFSIAKNQTFYVTSYFGGKAKLYKFWIDPTNLKAMAECTSVSESKDPTGIRVDIDIDDRFREYQIRDGVDRFARYCLSNFTVTVDNRIYTDRFTVPEQEATFITPSNNSDIYVAVGNMVYHLSAVNFSSAIKKGISYYITANKKQIDMAPQRETIPLVAKNIEFINNEIAAINSGLDGKTRFFCEKCGAEATTSAFFVVDGYITKKIQYERNAKFMKWNDLNVKSQKRVMDIINKDEFTQRGTKRLVGVSENFTGYIVDSEDIEFNANPLLVNTAAEKKVPIKREPGEPKEAGHDFSKEFHKRDSFVLGVSNKWISWNNLVDTSRAAHILNECETMVVRRSSCGVKPIQEWNDQTIYLGKKYIVRRCTDEFFDSYVAEHPESDLLAVLPKLMKESKLKAKIAEVQRNLDSSKDSYRYEYWGFWTRFSEDEIKGIDQLKALIPSNKVTVDNVDQIEDALNKLSNDWLSDTLRTTCAYFSDFKRLFNSYDPDHSEKLIRALAKGLAL